MNEVKFNLDKEGHGAFIITDSGEQLGEMKVGISGNSLTIYHTEVLPKAEGKVPNQDLHALGNYDMIIVAHPALRKQADRLAKVFRDNVKKNLKSGSLAADIPNQR